MPLKPHPTDPDKMVYVSRQYDLPNDREWVGLTDEELEPLCKEWRIIFGSWAFEFARAIEAKLKEKNNV